MIKISYTRLKEAMLNDKHWAVFYDGSIQQGYSPQGFISIPCSSIAEIDTDMDYFLVEIEQYFGRQVTLIT